jgi:hypothetical protein
MPRRLKHLSKIRKMNPLQIKNQKQLLRRLLQREMLKIQLKKNNKLKNQAKIQRRHYLARWSLM